MKVEPAACEPPLLDGATADGVYTWRFACDGYDPETFVCVQWAGEEAVSRPYRFELLLTSVRRALDLTALRGSRASFTIAADGAAQAVRHGILTAVEQLDCDDHYAWYRVVLEPRLARLREFAGSAVFLDVDLPELIRQVLVRSSIMTDADFRVAPPVTQATLTQNSFVCQYQESDLDFLSRRLEHAGWYYTFEQGEDAETIVFCSSREQQVGEAIPLAYRPGSVMHADEAGASATSWRTRVTDAPATVELRDFAGSHANLSLEVSAVVEGGSVGVDGRYADHYDCERAGARLATLRAERAACDAAGVSATSCAAALGAGCVVALRDHFRADCNMRYYVTAVRHEGSQPLPLVSQHDAARASRYRNTFSALPETRQFRPALATPVPRMPSCVSAVVDAQSGGPVAEINENGCYKVRFAFCAPRADGRNSAWVRLATPYAGARHGLHFPLHKGSEVLVAFVNDDPDRPVIVGAVPNSENPGVVTQANPTQNIVHTAGGNSLVMDDEAGAQRVALASPTAGTSLVLGAAAQEGVALSSQGHVDIAAGSYHRAVGSSYEEYMCNGAGAMAHGLQRKHPHKPATATQPRIVNSEYKAGLDQSFDADQGAGMVVQNYLGATVQNYAGMLSEFVEGIATTVNAGLTFETFAGAHVELHRGVHFERHLGEKETTAPAKNVIVDGETRLQSGQLDVTAQAGELFFGELQIVATTEATIQSDSNITLELTDGASVAVTPDGVSVNSGAGIVEVAGSGMQVTAESDINLDAGGEMSVAAAALELVAGSDANVSAETITLLADEISAIGFITLG